jgi:hypothetical protein
MPVITVIALMLLSFLLGLHTERRVQAWLAETDPNKKAE